MHGRTCPAECGRPLQQSSGTDTLCEACKQFRAAKGWSIADANAWRAVLLQGARHQRRVGERLERGLGQAQHLREQQLRQQRLVLVGERQACQGATAQDFQRDTLYYTAWADLTCFLCRTTRPAQPKPPGC